MNTKPTAIDTHTARAAAINIKLVRQQQLANATLATTQRPSTGGNVDALGRGDALEKQ